MRREIQDPIKHGTNYYGFHQYSFKSLAQMCSMNYCVDKRLQGEVLMEDSRMEGHHNIFFLKTNSTPSAIKRDKNSQPYPQLDFEISRQMCFTSWKGGFHILLGRTCRDQAALLQC